MLEKIYKITAALFIVVSVLILAGINTGYITYGEGLQNPVMCFGIILVVINSLIVFIIIRKNPGRPADKILASLSILLIVLFAIYCIVELQ